MHMTVEVLIVHDKFTAHLQRTHVHYGAHKADTREQDNVTGGTNKYRDGATSIDQHISGENVFEFCFRG